jgi:hypothetical protein
VRERGGSEADAGSLSSKIEDVYLYTWHRILNQKAEHVWLAKAIPVWVLNAERSTAVEELRMAIATSSETHRFDAGRMVPRSTLLSLCVVASSPWRRRAISFVSFLSGLVAFWCLS